MRFSVIILFLGGWMTGQSSMSTGQVYPSPSISVTPSKGLTVGGYATICCESEYPNKTEFRLHKETNSSIYPMGAEEESRAQFPIANASQSDAGIYWCQYCVSNQSCSNFSDKVSINVKDPSLSKPLIRARPRGQLDLGLNVTIECQGPENGLNFSLHKSRNLIASQKTKPGRNKAKFFLSMRREDAGSYVCRYHQKGNPFVLSEPSDPMDLLLRDPGLLQPSIKVTPGGQLAPGSNVTIECQGPHNGLNFSLHKSGNLTASQKAEPDRNTTKFSFFRITSENAGRYTCQYFQSTNSFIWSRPSNPVKLVVTGSTTVIWASSAVGLLLLLLLLLLVAFLLYRQRRTAFTVRERQQPVNTPMKTNIGAEQDRVTYAEVRIVQSADPARVSEQCIYASVAKGRNREGQRHRDSFGP